MIVGGIQKSSTIDFPGMISCVIFTRGCNLDCFYCHNRELLGDGPNIDEDEIMTFLKKRQGLLDGVVISGGEPTLQPDLKEFAKQVKGLGYSIKLDTNGQRPDAVEDLCKANLLDYVAVDIKARKDEYTRVTRCEGFEKALETLEVLRANGVDFEVRTTLYPSMTVDKLLDLLNDLPKMPMWRLNYFQMPDLIKKCDEEIVNAKALTKIKVSSYENILKAIQPNLVF
ncbi:MAG TPA: anaerobic ribonucleoside-triphosphate reductase activating protein [Clostridia bacterium]|nr:anaerobic ribonucleoside-triphosphate reductase activating protein [Clostridia bacterium]